MEVKLHRSVGEMKSKGQKGRGNNVQGKNFLEILGISPCSGTCKGTEIIKAAAKGWKSAPLWVSGVQRPRARGQPSTGRDLLRSQVREAPALWERANQAKLCNPGPSLVCAPSTGDDFSSHSWHITPSTPLCDSPALLPPWVGFAVVPRSFAN